MKKIKIFPLILIICLVFCSLAPSALALDEPELNAEAAVLVDLNSGRVIFSRNMDEQRAPASLTKVMTALVTLDAIDSGRLSLDDMVTAQEDCRQGLDEDSSTSGIVPGVQSTLREFLICSLLQSANEACNVLATYVSGSVSAFVDQMNEKAQELGCKNTHFANTNGLPAEGHYSSAYDMYLITQAAMKYPVFMEICNMKSYTPQSASINEGKEMTNSNALLVDGVYSVGRSYVYEPASGVKTGYTRAAGYCLISTAEKDGKHVLAVIMGCDGWLNANIEEYKNFEDSIILYDWCFNNFRYKSILSEGDHVIKVNVSLAKGDSTIILHPQRELSALLPSDLSAEQIELDTVVYDELLTAPIKAGTVLGEVRVTINGEDYGKVSLINTTEVELARSRYIILKLKGLLSKGWVLAIILVLVFLAVIYILLVVKYRRMRRQYLRDRRAAEQRRRQQAARRQYESDIPDYRFSDEDFPEDEPRQ